MEQIDVDQLLLSMLAGLQPSELTGAEVDALRERFGGEWVDKMLEVSRYVQVGSH